MAVIIFFLKVPAAFRELPLKFIYSPWVKEIWVKENRDETKSGGEKERMKNAECR